MRRRAAYIFLVLAAALSGCGSADQAAVGATRVTATVPPATTAPPARVTLETPSDGVTTTRRTIAIGGVGSQDPRGGVQIITVRVNGRLIDATPETTDRYRVRAALNPGQNRITVTAENFKSFEAPKLESTAVAGPIVVTRTPSADTGVLDLATAYLVTRFSYDFYWLCGESDDCGHEPYCLAVGPRRVDCPAATWSSEDPIRRCALVMTVRLRGARIFFSTYPCSGRLKPNVRRHVQPGFYRVGKRFRIDDARDDYDREEINAPNRYGIPRFDIDRDQFIP